MLFASLASYYFHVAEQFLGRLFPPENAMLFTSLPFLYFFGAVFTVYWLLPWQRARVSFLLFITFFPHLVAGPIVRARDFLPQVRRDKHWSWARLHLGVQIVLLGLVKKLVIADRMAIFADPVFADPTQYKTGAVWLAVLA